MGKRGPAKTPLALRKLTGRNVTVGHLTLPAGLPVMPGFVTPSGAAVWRDLAPVLLDMGTLTPADGYAFGMLCQSLAGWQRAHKRAEAKDRVAVTPNGFEQVSATHTVERQMFGDTLKLMIQFGLTPSARASLKIEGKPAGSALHEFIEAVVS